MNEEGIKVSVRPILIPTCFLFVCVVLTDKTEFICDDCIFSKDMRSWYPYNNEFSERDKNKIEYNLIVLLFEHTCLPILLSHASQKYTFKNQNKTLATIKRSISVQLLYVRHGNFLYAVKDLMHLRNKIQKEVCFKNIK